MFPLRRGCEVRFSLVRILGWMGQPLCTWDRSKLSCHRLIMLSKQSSICMSGSPFFCLFRAYHLKITSLAPFLPTSKTSASCPVPPTANPTRAGGTSSKLDVSLSGLLVPFHLLLLLLFAWSCPRYEENQEGHSWYPVLINYIMPLIRLLSCVI